MRAGAAGGSTAPELPPREQRHGGSVGKGLGYSLCSFLLGWWGIPWGPIYTISSIFTNFRGGRDVTEQLVQAVNEAPPEAIGPTVG